MKSGFVAIIGKPNAGKSTLINALIKEKIAITSYKAQTTRNAIIGVLNRNDCQIVFCDTPGIHKAATALGSYMNKEALKQADGVDVIYYIVDAKKGMNDEDHKILNDLFKYGVPVFLLLNKIDLTSKEELFKRIEFADRNYDFKEIIPLSALNEDNLSELVKTTLNYLDDDLIYYPKDYVTNTSLEFQIAEIIREKVLICLNKEIPHLCACKVDSFKETEHKVLIEASIICDKDSHKAIIIGKGGSMLKKINTLASKDLKAKLNKKVELSLFVKVEKDWMNKNTKLFDLGYFIGDKYDH